MLTQAHAAGAWGCAFPVLQECRQGQLLLQVWLCLRMLALGAWHGSGLQP